MVIQYSRTISLFTVSGLAALKQEGREGGRVIPIAICIYSTNRLWQTLSVSMFAVNRHLAKYNNIVIVEW